MGTIAIIRMPHLDEALDLKDDWSGVTDSRERRKRQNRLHQRAWRRRQAALRSGNATEEPSVPSVQILRIERETASPPDSGSSRSSSTASAGSSTPSTPPDLALVAISNSKSAGGAWDHGTLTPQERRPFPLPTSTTITMHFANPNMPGSVKALHNFIRATSNVPLSSALLSSAFPLSQDHKLITMVQYNVLRGMFTNTVILSMEDEVYWDCGYGLNVGALPGRPIGRPANFEPTSVQRTVEHPVWIDIVPMPQLRDNLILETGNFDAEDLCDDLVGGIYEGFDDVQVRGMMLWGEPWDEEGWEVSEGFAKKWGFLLRGCDNLMRATNTWRRARGEKDLVLEL